MESNQLYFNHLLFLPTVFCPASRISNRLIYSILHSTIHCIGILVIFAG